MARTVTDEQIKLSIIVNGDPAQKEIHELKEQIIELSREQKDLLNQEKQALKTYNETQKKYKEVSREVNQSTRAYNAANLSLEKHEIKLREIESSSGKTSREYKKQERIVKEASKAVDKLTKSQELLISKQADARRQEGVYYNRLVQTKVALGQVNGEIEKKRVKMNQLTQSLDINRLTLSQLHGEARRLRVALLNMAPNSPIGAKLNAELTAINARIAELSGRARAAQSSLGSLADKFNRYQGLALSVIAASTGIVLSAQKIIDMNGKLSDSQSDVMKTTGMTKKEVDELTKSFGLFKTRTARIELLELATEAGRLGISGVENVRAFTEQANKLKVALGDDLSSEQIREVGKMTEVYKVGEQTGKDFVGAMDALGSAINEVAATGANQAGYLVDYLKRTSGIAVQAKLSADANLAYAATFDEIGQSVEVTGTMMNKLWMDMFSNPAEYAKIAKMSVGDFNKLLNTDANAAMLKFLQGVNGNSEGMSVMLAKFKDLEVGGARGVQALSALAANTDKLKDKLVISSQALSEATSLTNEYTLKNNNLQATIEKVKKTMTGWFSSEGIIDGLSAFYLWFAKLIGATDDIDGSVTRFRDRLIVFLKVLTIIIASYISYSAALRLTALWTKTIAAAQALLNLIQTRGSLISNTLRGAQLLLASAYNLLTGNIGRATAAMRLFNATTKLNPIGLLLGLIVALGTALVMFRNRVDTAVVATKALSDVHIEAAKSIAKEKAELNLLRKVASDETISKQKRLEAIQKLNQIIPDYIGNLTLENIKTAEGKKILDAYTDSLYKNARARAIKNKYEELVKQQVEIEEKTLSEIDNEGNWFTNFFGKKGNVPEGLRSDKDIKQWATNFTKTLRDTDGKLLVEGSEIFMKYRDLHYKNMKSRLNGLIEDKNQELEIINAKIKALEPELLKNSIEDVKTDDSIIPGVTGDKTKTKEKYDDSYLENERRLREELRKLQQKTDDEYFKTLEDNYNKEVNLQKNKHKNLVDDLTAEIEAKQVLINKIDQDVAAASKAGDNKKANSLKAQKQIIIDMQGEINKQIEFQEAIHKKELSKIQADYEKKVIQGIDQVYKDQKELRAMKHEAEMVNVNLSNKDRQRKRREFERQELDEERKYLETKLQTLSNILSGIDVEGINFDLLPPDVRQRLEYDIEFLKNAIGALSSAKRDLENPPEQDLGLGGQTDILGYSQDQWDKFFQNIEAGTIGIQTMSMAVGAMQNMWGEYDKMITAQENRQLQNYQRHNDGRKRMLQRQLDTGAITQEQYNKKVQQLDEDLDRKKFEIELQQAKRQRAMALVNIASNTAQAIMRIWADVPKFDFGSSSFILSALVAATGAMQASAVMKQPLPTRGFEEGLYPVIRQQDKKPFSAQFGGNIKTGFYNKPTILVGEGAGSMPEMIIDKQAFRQISPETKQALISELRLIKGFEKGLYSQLAQNNIAPSSSNDNNSNELIMAMMSLISENTNVLKDLRDQGVVGKFYDKDMESFRALDKGMKDYREITNKAKR